MNKFRLLSIGILIIIMSCQLTAQDTVYVNGVPKIYHKKKVDDYNSSPSPLQKDDYLIEVSYGYPFIPAREASFFGINYFANTRTSKITRNTNHLCLRADYQLNPEFSVGLEFTYASMDFDYVRTFTTYTSVNVTSTDTSYTAKITKIRFLAKMGYHFNISDRFDAFGTIGMGYKQFTYSTQDSYLSTANLVNDIIPVATRVSLGGRFFLNRNFAMHVEFGMGGPLMQIGATFKFHSNANY